jgi:hypothetical protein
MNWADDGWTVSEADGWDALRFLGKVLLGLVFAGAVFVVAIGVTMVAVGAYLWWSL